MGPTPSDSEEDTMVPTPTDSFTWPPTDTAMPTPTIMPTGSVEPAPTDGPTKEPTQSPTMEPTQSPTMEPTQSPTKEPTQSPTEEPTQSPTKEPTQSPTENPTQSPTESDGKIMCGVNNPTECAANEVCLTVEIQANKNYEGNNQFVLKQMGGKKIAPKGKKFKIENGQLWKYEQCQPRNQCYQFQMKDNNKNGLTNTGEGMGWYSIHMDKVLLHYNTMQKGNKLKQVVKFNALTNNACG